MRPLWSYGVFDNSPIETALTVGGCGVLSLRHFRLARWWCSLSLGGWSPKNPARRSSTCSGRLGGAAAAGRTMVRSPAAPDSFSVIFRFGADAGARAIGATDGAAAVELRGLRQQPDRNRTDSGGLRRALSPTFPAGEMVVFFIPWRVVAEESGAAQFDLLGPPGWCSGCWPHDGEVAGGAGFLFSDIPVRGRRWSSGDRSDRRCGRCGATGSSTTARSKPH